MKHLENVFEKHNNFPKRVIEQLVSEFQLEDSKHNQNDVNKTLHLLLLLLLLLS